MSINYFRNKLKNSLLELLQKYEEMSDGTLCKYTSSDYAIKLQVNAKLYLTKYFPIPINQKWTLKERSW